MKFAFTPLAFASLLAALQGAKAIIINSPPALVQCQPAALMWSGGAGGTVFLSVLPGGQTGAAPLEALPNQSGATGSYTWTVNIAAGTQVTLEVNDSAGVPNYSGIVTIQPSSDTSCLGASPSGGAASSSAPASSSASTPASSSHAASSSAATSSSASHSSAAASSSSSAASSTHATVLSSAASSPTASASSNSGASAILGFPSVAAMGAAALAGLAGAIAVFA